jgi:hypothetical protein
MSLLRGQKSYSFIVGYLMGVEERVLSRDYTSEYRNSNNLAKFKDVPQAEALRALSRVKQSFIRNHQLYNGVVRMETVTDGYLNEELAILKDNSIFLVNALMELGDIYKVLNKVTMHINIILPDVLDYMKVPYSSHLATMFHLPTMDKTAVTKLMTNLKDKWSNLPHGMIVVKTNRIDRELPYILQNDRNLFVGTHGITNTRFNEDTIVPSFSWENIGITQQGRGGVTEVTSVNPEVGDPNKWLSIAKGSLLYVDCDNMDIFNFMAMLQFLSGLTDEGKSHVIKLFVDVKSSPFWKLVDKLSKGKYTFEFIDVNRIKETKSVVDVAMAVHITRDILTQGCKDVGIFSSDSDFYGLLENLDGVNFYIGYNGKDVSSDYVQYLTDKGFVTFNMQNIDMVGEKNREIRLSIIANLCLAHMASLPMGKWNAVEVGKELCGVIAKDIRYSEIFESSDIKDLIGVVFDNLKMEMSGSRVTLRSLDAEIEVTLGAA